MPLEAKNSTNELPPLPPMRWKGEIREKALNELVENFGLYKTDRPKAPKRILSAIDRDENQREIDQIGVFD